ncbi:MAG: hypothetical protein ACK4ZW_06125 [Blastomonas sp.]
MTSKTARPTAASRLGFVIAPALLAAALFLPAHAAPDPGRKACAKEARVLCPAEMKSMSRKKVEACMIAKVERTSPTCKAAMYRIKAEREQGSSQ